MTIYILNIVLIILGAIFLLDMFRNKISKSIYCILVVIVLASVAGLRHVSIGIDTRNYLIIFKSAIRLSFKDILNAESEVETGYMIFQHIVSLFSTHFNVLLMVISLLFIASIARLIYRHSAECCMSFLFFIGLGFYTFSMTGIRQSLAMAIILFSFDYIKKRKFIPFFLIIILASTIHLSAIIFIPAYFLAYKKITKSYLIIIAALIPASFMFKGVIYSFLIRASGYGYIPISNEGPYVLLTLMISVFVAGFIQREDVLKRDKNNLIYYNMSVISILIGMLTFVNPSALRAAYYYHIYLILFIPEIVMSIRDEKLRRIIYSVSIVGIIFLEVRGLRNSTSVVPYMFFWQ